MLARVVKFMLDPPYKQSYLIFYHCRNADSRTLWTIGHSLALNST